MIKLLTRVLIRKILHLTIPEMRTSDLSITSLMVEFDVSFFFLVEG